tara:strand:- start:336 stop:548 length:213 start_codon:yes stop_codon:yes gene_type:complete
MDDDKTSKKLLSEVPDFTSVFERKSATEVQGMLDEFIASQLSEDEVEEVSSESQKYGGDSAIDQKFSELL